MLPEAPEGLPGDAWGSTWAPLGSFGGPSWFPGTNLEVLWGPPGTLFCSLWVPKGALEVKLLKFFDDFDNKPFEF